MSQVVKIYTVFNLAQELRQEGREMKDGLYSMCGESCGLWVVVSRVSPVRLSAGCPCNAVVSRQICMSNSLTTIGSEYSHSQYLVRQSDSYTGMEGGRPLLA